MGGEKIIPNICMWLLPELTGITRAATSKMVKKDAWQAITRTSGRQLPQSPQSKRLPRPA
jgi:hypothetical protein